MGWHKARHKTNGLRLVKVLEVAEICAKVGASRFQENVLANRWFQPLTHVSSGGFPRDCELSCQREKREKRVEHRFVVAQSTAQSVQCLFRDKIRAGMTRQRHPALTNTRRMRAMDDDTLDRHDRAAQQHYTGLSLEVDPRYSGPCTKLDQDEAIALLAELLDYFGLPEDLPVPPYGLPGHFSKPRRQEMDLIREGIRYLRAIARGERKTLWKIHDSIGHALRERYWEGRRYVEPSTEIVIDGSQIIARMQTERAREEAETSVYFIESASGGIKIGKARDVQLRLRGLQTAHPVKLTVLATTTGGDAAEKAYHRQFAEHRLHGEWFSPHESILAEIERLKGCAQ